MPRGEQVAKPTEREMRLAGRFFGGAIPSALTTSAAPIHHLPEAGTMFKRLLVLGPAALLGAACGIDRPHPTDATVASSATVAFSAVKFWEAGATVSWNKLASDLATAAPTPGINARRLSAYLSLAQLRAAEAAQAAPDRKSTRLNSSHSQISYAVFCLKKKKGRTRRTRSSAVRSISRGSL